MRPNKYYSPDKKPSEQIPGGNLDLVKLPKIKEATTKLPHIGNGLVEQIEPLLARRLGNREIGSRGQYSGSGVTTGKGLPPSA